MYYQLVNTVRILACDRLVNTERVFFAQLVWQNTVMAKVTTVVAKVTQTVQLARDEFGIAREMFGAALRRVMATLW